MDAGEEPNRVGVFCRASAVEACWGVDQRDGVKAQGLDSNWVSTEDVLSGFLLAGQQAAHAGACVLWRFVPMITMAAAIDEGLKEARAAAGGEKHLLTFVVTCHGEAFGFNRYSSSSYNS